ncbi:MAG: PTS sugar transporter subunit IIA [Gemmataceae bacterium]|nr:PTS sugar transporter subunit IIA [Gemmataceae bacterium]
MDQEVMDLEQLARYLRRDAREISKLANRARLPGRKVGDTWRFATADVQYWIETQLSGYTDEELSALEIGVNRGGSHAALLVTPLLSESAMAVPLAATTKASVLRELVSVAEKSWQVYDPAALLEAMQQREELGSTALDSGVALPHPRRPLPASAQGESFVVYARTSCGIPFGAPGGGLTDLFFLVCCRDRASQLRVSARLARLLLRPNFLEQLRAADTVHDSLQIISQAERELLG